MIRADPAVAAGEQSLDDAGLAVVVAEADRAAVPLVGADRRRAASCSRSSVVSWSSWAAHWNGVCGLGTKPPIETVQRMSLRPVTSRPLAITFVARSAISSTSSSVSVGQAAHEVELHLPPAVGVRRRDGADQVLLVDRLVDHLAHPLAAALGGEGQAGATAVAGELVGQRDVEGVDPGRGQRQRDVGALVAVGQALGDLGDLGVVGAGQREQPDLLEAGLADAVLDHRADRLDRALAHRAGDHAGLAEAAAAGAAAEDLDAEALVHGLGQRHQRLGRVGPRRRGPSACACGPGTGCRAGWARPPRSCRRRRR